MVGDAQRNRKRRERRRREATTMARRNRPYRECQHCGSEQTQPVASIEGDGYYWVRWECRDCHRSSEQAFGPQAEAAA